MGSPWLSKWRLICIGGLIAGTVDIGSACAIYRADPVVILQAIAVGVLGRASFGAGLPSAALGLMLQWGMSIVIAYFCAVADERIAYLRHRWVSAGLVYGTITFFVMNYLVVPLSRVGKIPAFSIRWFVENMLAMFLFGLIITYVNGQSTPKTRGD
jgi:hypothetical protein